MTAEILESRGNCTSASNALPDSLCPGRHIASLGLPEQSTPEADSGTRIHEWLANYFRGKFKHLQTPLSSEELEVAKILETKIDAFVVKFAKHGKMTLTCLNYCEHRMWIQFGSFSHSGQADMVLVDGFSVAVLDYKTGWETVSDSDTNLQLRDLAVLAWRNFHRIKSVEVAIIDRFREPVVTRYELEDLKRAEKELKARVKASNAKNAKRIPGPIQCKYCKAFGAERCPESSTLAKAITGPLFGTYPPLMPVNRLMEIQRLKPLVTKLCDQVTVEIRRRLKEDPASVPGASLRDPKVLTPITDPDTVFERLTALGVPRKAIMESVKMTKGPLEDALRETGLTGKALAQKMNELLSGCTTEKPCEPEVEVE